MLKPQFILRVYWTCKIRHFFVPSQTDCLISTLGRIQGRPYRFDSLSASPHAKSPTHLFLQRCFLSIGVKESFTGALRFQNANKLPPKPQANKNFSLFEFEQTQSQTEPCTEKQGENRREERISRCSHHISLFRYCSISDFCF